MVDFTNKTLDPKKSEIDVNIETETTAVAARSASTEQAANRAKLRSVAWPCLGGATRDSGQVIWAVLEIDQLLIFFNFGVQKVHGLKSILVTILTSNAWENTKPI